MVKEGKVAYIYDAGTNALYTGPDAVDVMLLVKKNLGIPDVPVMR